ncbi:uncharacterized protein CBL_20740, partial [Carabus blaptoides fortunei]
MKPLFGACLDEMLVSFANIQVCEGDGFPNLMCVQCVLQCSRAYTFKQLCEKSDATLRQYLSPEFQEQLSNTIADQQTKQELQEQLQFNNLEAVVEISNNLTHEFVTYDEQECELEVKPDLYEMNAIEATDISEQEPIEIIVPKIETKTEGVNKYQCKKCSESFGLKVDLKVHMMSHPKENDHVCEVCSKGFPEARILKRHLKIHLDKKPHVCDVCNMSFAESSNLSKHKKKHTGELRNIKGKPHLCSVCGRAFKWASSLSKHMKYHTGHKLLSCKFCNKQYVE